MIYYFRGGIGDLLQTLWFIKSKPNETYIIQSHFKKIKDLLDYYGVNNCHYYPFCDFNSHNEQIDLIIKTHAANGQSDIKEIPRVFYNELDFGEEINLKAKQYIDSFKEKKSIIGIHPFRSDFAVSVYNDFNLPAKKIPIEITTALTQGNDNYLIFGSQKDFLEYQIKETDNIKIVKDDNILVSLSCVKYCDCLIGLDSCFKSVSSMQKIKTLCIIGDFDDPIRDQLFVNQYVKDGVMKIFKTKDIEQQKEDILYFLYSNT